MLNVKDIKELIEAIDKTSIQQFEMEDGSSKIKISKCKEVVGAAVFSAPAPAVASPIQVEAATVPAEPQEAEDVYIVKSPIVGTFYASSSPNADHFVRVGAKVSKGDTLCIVEAMKIMNEIESEENGEVVEILVKNEDIVEYGQPLMKIRRA
ncbi:acetyl-CoA carboxylase biotin carboxyl carrier protein [Peptoclostridium litorale DSM 5388]|uniref:Biotin carboxyl carrier protein of acetyl-CoA carboxylase n=1 Tax=Peptoclostridium litorale DSM 5388 TaxID=1121324 RepID=A0A069RGU0_PEPLI|nr:acetyl-CoA carboxylase biotin carboxyl carrier protein [Peptoclostridium litorale]KDR96221.1 acetyl-coenzyme A carboxylase biotin carboxyl carrier protein subunit AccB [Peptoclostridium litorale DSM 5388]SIO13893.1 acetyl-CoA carboxylase biotin carboxyl carrier protein [Peptoclostridium litorale DSM 5388]